MAASGSSGCVWLKLDDGQELRVLEEEAAEARAERQLPPIVEEAVGDYHAEPAAWFEEVQRALDDEELGVDLATVSGELEGVEGIGPEVVRVTRLYHVAEGRIAHHQREDRTVRSELRVPENNVQCGVVDLDVGMTVLLEQEVRLTDAPQGVVDFDAEHVLLREIVLPPLNVRLTSVVGVDVVPHLEQGLEKEAAAPRRWIEGKGAVRGAEERDDEAHELASGEVLAEIATEDRTEEMLEGVAERVHVHECEPDVLDGLHHGIDLVVG